MTLNLNIDALARPGRAAAPLVVEGVRDLGEADLALLAVAGKNSVAPPLKRITDRHHSLARLLAGGATEGEAAAIVGYSLSRVSILKGDPAFQELLALYRKQADREFTSVMEHMAGLSKDALLELRERIETEPTKFSNRELLDTITNFVDRADIGEGMDKLPTTIELIAQPFDDDERRSPTMSAAGSPANEARSDHDDDLVGGGASSGDRGPAVIDATEAKGEGIANKALDPLAELDFGAPVKPAVVE